MNLDELQSVQARERQSDSLQELRPSFYRDAAEFVRGLRAERSRAAAGADEPFEDPTVTQLTDDIRTAEQTVEAIYERRVGKVVKLASLAAANMPSDDAGLTTEEQELYETLTESIEDHREEVLATLGGDVASGGPSPAPDEPLDESDVGSSEKTVGAADVMGAAGADERSTDAPDEPETGSNEDESPPPAADADARTDRESESAEATPDSVDEEGEARTTVRITRDVGAILGVDEREYDLATDDVVTLPAANAEPLIERDAAERLE